MVEKVAVRRPFLLPLKCFNGIGKRESPHRCSEYRTGGKLACLFNRKLALSSKTFYILPETWIRISEERQ